MTNNLTQLEKEVQYDFKTGGPLVWEPAVEQPKQADLVYVGGKIFNYKTDRHGSIPLELILVVTTEERKRRVEELLAEGISANPDRLADVLLYDKLFNPSLSKMSDEEYPIMSERQYERRQNAEFATGKRLDQNAADSQNHMKPTRRNRSDYENRFVDKKAKIRNKERKKRYAEFTKVQPVHVRKINE